MSSSKDQTQEPNLKSNQNLKLNLESQESKVGTLRESLYVSPPC